MAKGDDKAGGEKGKPTAAPQIIPPNPANAIAHVPTHTSDEKRTLERQNSKDKSEPAEQVEEDVCFICAEPITFWSVGVCGHRTCHVCAVRLRTFYKKTDCTFCKTPNPSVLFSRSPETPFPTKHHLKPSPSHSIAKAQAEAKKGERWDKGLTLPGTLDLGEFTHVDDKLSIVFEDEEMMEATLTLLRFNCPYPDCSYQAINWSNLERHTISLHGLAICTLCRLQLSRFAHEQMLYPPALLPLHDPSRVKRGQKPPKPRGEKEIELVKGWEAPHPMCEFCHLAFFGPDELFKHMKTDHEECHVCREMGNPHVYFDNYVKLEQHWRDEHHPCTQTQCIEDRFVVFGSELDLRAHMVDVHAGQMSARDRAQARQLPIDFGSSSHSAQPQSSSSGRGFSLGNRPAAPTRMRAADRPQVQALDYSPPMTNEQRAQMRRQVEVDVSEGNGGGQSTSRRRGFVTGLSASGAWGGGSSARVQPPSVVPSRAATPREDVDDATASRHNELLSRVSMLTNGSQNKLSSFRSAVRSFKTHESSSRDMVDSIFNVFDRDLDVTVGIVREVAKLFGGDGDKEQEKDVLAAINALRAEQADQFPSLGSAPTGFGSSFSGVASGKVLNAKRATRTGGGSRVVWDRVEAAASSHPVNRPRPTTGAGGRWVPGAGGIKQSNTSMAAFPSLGGGSSSAGPSSSGQASAGSSRNGSGGSGGYTTPWAAGGAGPSSRTPSALAGPVIRSVHNPSTSTSKKPKALNAAAFPTLPASSNRGLTSDEKKALFSKPSARGPSAVVPPPPSGVESLSLEEQGDGQRQAGGGKRKGKQKQTLFTISARP